MITIEISEEVETHQDMVYCLEEIIRLINKGFTSGVGPDWSFEGEEEPEPKDDD